MLASISPSQPTGPGSLVCHFDTCLVQWPPYPLSDEFPPPRPRLPAQAHNSPCPNPQVPHGLTTPLSQSPLVSLAHVFFRSFFPRCGATSPPLTYQPPPPPRPLLGFLWVFGAAPPPSCAAESPPWPTSLPPRAVSLTTSRLPSLFLGLFAFFFYIYFRYLRWVLDLVLLSFFISRQTVRVIKIMNLCLFGDDFLRFTSTERVAFVLLALLLEFCCRSRDPPLRDGECLDHSFLNWICFRCCGFAAEAVPRS